MYIYFIKRKDQLVKQIVYIPNIFVDIAFSGCYTESDFSVILLSLSAQCSKYATLWDNINATKISLSFI